MASSCLGVTAAPALVDGPEHPNAKAKSVIYIFISGGLTHIDTFDPKPNADTSVRGDVKAIDTNVSGIRVADTLPLLAQQMDKIALIRNMSTTQGAHEQGKYFMRTGYTMRSNLIHPSMGSWISRLGTRSKSVLPDFVTVGAGNEHTRQGFFSPEYAPLPVGDPSAGLKDARRRKNTSKKEFLQQMALRDLLDQDFKKRHSAHSSVQAYDAVFADAMKLMDSKELEAFDIRKESKTTHRMYGDHSFAKGALLARRLVQHGVKCVEVEFGGFDWHDNLFDQAEASLPVLDQALAALISDLHKVGLLDTTLVVLGTEFGRDPVINENAGRDHFPKAFSTLMAGAGIKGGSVYGQTNETGSEILGESVDAEDFNATIAQILGLSGQKEILSPNKRPFKMAGKNGKAIQEILS